MAYAELAKKGWHLTEQGIRDCTDERNRRTDFIIKNALDTDLKEIGEKWLPEGLHSGKLDYIQGPVVLQIMKMKNIAAPKDSENTDGVPRLMKLTLSDGQSNCTAVETEILKRIGFDTPPGSKICIGGTVEVESNILLLNNKNTQFLGGWVEKLAENWQLKKSLKSRSKVILDGGPPPYVPFGHRMASKQPNPKRDNFKALNQDKETSNEQSNEFQQQRQATIAELTQAKSTKSKTFGGGKFVAPDSDITTLTDMGFSREEASNALYNCNGNVREAIDVLLSRRSNYYRSVEQNSQVYHAERSYRRDRHYNY